MTIRGKAGRPSMLWRLACLGLFLMGLAGWPGSALALRPLWAPLALVAGSDVGSHDGPFLAGELDHPGGLLFDQKNERLIVCDTANGLIRVIDQRRGNALSTLGLAAGQVRQGSFGLVSPTAACWIDPGRTMVVLDPAAKSLVLVDLDAMDPVAKLTEGMAVGVSGAAKVVPAGIFTDANDIDFAGGNLWGVGRGAQDLFLVQVSGTAMAWQRGWAPAGGRYGAGLAGVRAFNGRVFAIQRIPKDGQLFCLTSADGRPLSCSSPASAMPWPDSLTMVVQTGVAEAHPWAFVKDAETLAIVCDSPWLGLEYDGWGQPKKKWAAYDPEDRICGLEDNGLWSKDNKLLWEDPLQKGRPWIFHPDFAVADPQHRAWYLCDPGDNRVVLFRPIAGDDRRHMSLNTKGWHDYDYPVGHPSYVRRLAVAGGSISFLPTDTQKRAHSFNKRLAWHLNWMASERDLPVGFETVFVGDNETMELNGESCLNRLRRCWDPIVKDYQPDGFVCVLSVMDPFFIVDDFFKRRGDNVGLVEAKPDIEFALDPDPAKFSPLYRDLLGYLRAHPSGTSSISVSKNSQVYFDRRNTAALLHAAQMDPGLYGALMPILGRYFDVIAAKLKEYGKARGAAVPLTVVFLPDASQLSRPETILESGTTNSVGPMRAKLQALALEHGFQFIDTTDEFRLFAASAGFVGAFDHHFTRSGQDLMGQAVAQKMLADLDRYLPGPSPAGGMSR